MYITLIPSVLAGIGNMIWCGLSVGNALKRPIDGGCSLNDGRRILGDNKTWKGFVGMMALGTVFNVAWGVICGQIGMLEQNNYFYHLHDNTIAYNALVGLLCGFAYALFELPNSFIKRRAGIEPGKPPKVSNPALKAAGIFFDQADSVFGVVLVVALFYHMPIWFYLLYVCVGSLTHIVINVVLYLVKLRKNPF